MPTKTHPEYEDIWQDEDMIEHSDPDIKYLGVPACNINVPDSINQQVVAKYTKGTWNTEAQVEVDGEWWVASRNSLFTPDEADEWTPLGRVQRSLGLYTGLSLPARILTAPLYGLLVMVHCLMGKDVYYQILDTEER